MDRPKEDVALFDMDGTLFDHNAALDKDLAKLRSPEEPIYTAPIKPDYPQYIKERTYLIRESEEWWAKLPKFKLGWDVLKEARNLEFKIMILTQGPKYAPRAWSGKMICLAKHLPGVDVTMTRDKGLVYGRIFVDDYPPYAERWLSNRPRGLVVMPANKENESYKHPQVIRYDGTNLPEVIKRMAAAKHKQ